MTSDPKNTIAFQGAEGAHSDMACKNAYPYMDSMACNSFEDVLDAVRKETAAIGLVPFENSSAGRVAEMHYLLPSTDLHIVGEYFHTVHHHLLGTKDATLEDVKTVYSHPQALMQCREFLASHGMTAEPYSDTAAAAKNVAKWNDPSKAALASDLSCELYDLQMLKKNAEDKETNTTHFLALAKEPLEVDPENGPYITTILFTVRNIPSGLYKALGGFATNNINMLKLDSYIAEAASGTAQFICTVEGSSEDPNLQLAMEELGFFTKRVKILGVYPASNTRKKR